MSLLILVGVVVVEVVVVFVVVVHIKQPTMNKNGADCFCLMFYLIDHGPLGEGSMDEWLDKPKGKH